MFAPRLVYSPLDGMLVHHRTTPFPPALNSLVSIYTLTQVERGTMRVKCLATKTQHRDPGQFEPGSLDPESAESMVLAIRPRHLPQIQHLATQT